MKCSFGHKRPCDKDSRSNRDRRPSRSRSTCQMRNGTHSDASGDREARAWDGSPRFVREMGVCAGGFLLTGVVPPSNAVTSCQKLSNYGTLGPYLPRITTVADCGLSACDALKVTATTFFRPAASCQVRPGESCTV